MAIGIGDPTRTLSESEVRKVMSDGFKSADLGGKRLLFIIPDGTRTAPMPMLFRLINEELAGVAKQIDYLIALGTHIPMTDEQIAKLVGVTKEECAAKYPGVNVFNHEWQLPETLTSIGHISEGEIKTLSNGLLALGVDVTINKMVLNYDRLIVLGPVFPHEVAGFSGGNKYFFPGVSGPDVINLTHWVGALITNFDIIGTKHTPVRAVIDRATSFIKVPRLCLAFVGKGYEIAGMYFGTPEDAWARAADLSSQIHIKYVPRPYRQVLSIMPHLYDDIWTGAKGMYKMEPVIADGGEVIIYAPHIDEISYAHGKIIDEIGYHVRDYFVKQWDKFKSKPWGVLAHSTHLRGQGTYENGVETPRITVTLATRVPEERCRRINLNYRDPESIKISDFEGREDEGVLVVKKAGEMLYRLSE